MPHSLPTTIDTEEELEEVLSRPGAGVREALSEGRRGPLLVVGAGGKMGPTLARMAARALAQGSGASLGRRVIAVSRFSDESLRRKLESWGVETLARDLLSAKVVESLPDAADVVFMAGAKFGTTGAEAATWATNAYLAGLVAERYAGARLLVFSTGNVYPLVPVASGGAAEETPPAPLGEYAQSALARERVFEHFSRVHGTPVTVLRLNYAVELRYGVFLDIALRVSEGRPLDLTMGHFNAIWQGDANAWALRCLSHAKSPPSILNVTGMETLSVRQVALRFGELLRREPLFESREAETALLSDAARAHSLFGPPTVSTEQALQWVASWVRRGGRTLDKPTRYEARDGRF